jgi:CRP-like cAMP-binding protein
LFLNLNTNFGRIISKKKHLWDEPSKTYHELFFCFQNSLALYIFRVMKTELLRHFVQKLYPLTDEALLAFTNGWQPITVKRKTILTAAGETERYLYFVLEGLQRAFYIGEENKEATIVFTYPPSFSGVADSLLTQTPSLYFLETITASHLIRISYDHLNELMKSYPGIQQLIFKATCFALQGALQRHIELQCFSNEEKFKALLQRSPQVLHLVPHKYLASYLGMDPTNFSKLLATVKI